MTPRLKLHLMPYELIQLDVALGSLVTFRNEADGWERCAMTVLLLWHMKVKKLALWPKPEGNKVTIDAPTAYALVAVLRLEELNPTDPLENKLLRLADQIQQTFFRPIYNPPQTPQLSNGTDQP